MSFSQNTCQFSYRQPASFSREVVLKVSRCITGFLAVLMVIIELALPCHAAPTYRGFQLPLQQITGEVLDELKNNWHVNYLRVQIGNNEEMDGTVGAAYDQMMEEQFTLLDQKLPLIAARGLKVTFVLYSPPGGFEIRAAPAHHKMFSDRALQVDFVNTWRQIMTRYGSNSAIRSFVLANEPAMRKDLQGAGAKDWNGLLLETISAIRETHPTVELEVPALYGSTAQLPSLPPIADPHVSYYFNSYFFLLYQHSGISDIPSFSIAAPLGNQALSKTRQKLAPFYLKTYERVKRGLLPASAFPPRLNVGEVAVSACASDSGAFLNRMLEALETDESAVSRQSRADALAQWQKKRRRNRRLPAPVFTRDNFLKDVEVRSYAVHAYGESMYWDPRFSCDSGGNLSEAAEETDRAIVVKSFLSRNP